MRMIATAALDTVGGTDAGKIASAVEATLVTKAGVQIRSTEGTIARMGVAVLVGVAIIQEKGAEMITVKGVTRALAIAEIPTTISVTNVAKTGS